MCIDNFFSTEGQNQHRFVVQQEDEEVLAPTCYFSMVFIHSTWYYIFHSAEHQLITSVRFDEFAE